MRTGSRSPPGETGEILVRGAPVMLGYWRNAEATAKTLRDGWLWTGDVGALDADGFLTLKDRSKDVIISGGSNIYPREVEEVLLLHPALQEVSVVGRPSREWGEEVVAFVVAKPGAALDPAELDRLCLDHIARFKRPKSLLRRDRAAEEQLRQGAQDRAAGASRRFLREFIDLLRASRKLSIIPRPSRIIRRRAERDGRDAAGPATDLERRLAEGSASAGRGELLRPVGGHGMSETDRRGSS